MYRGFSYLHSRILLDLQDELTELEKELDDCDWDDAVEDPDRPRLRLVSEGQDLRTSSTVLREIKGKLLEYGWCGFTHSLDRS